MIDVYIEPNTTYFNKVIYFLGHVEMHISEGIRLSRVKTDANFVFTHDASSQEKNRISLCLSHYEKLSNLQPIDFLEIDGKEFVDGDFDKCQDIIATCIYVLNFYQEFEMSGASLDRFGRYKYSNSYQKKFGVTYSNLVVNAIQYFIEKKLKSTFLHLRSRIFLSHDIDSISGSFLQDGFYALRTGNISGILKILRAEISGNRLWENFDVINALHDNFKLKHTYFWLTENKRYGVIKNSDYRIEKIAAQVKRQKDSGLHKSVSPNSFETELKALPVKTNINRNHFLKYNISNHWDQLEAAGLTIDCSAGFAEQIGFRNNYGMPFIPYNFREDRPYKLLSVPLNIMDATLRNYIGLPMEGASKTIINFIEKNMTNSIISILWHNTFFTDYKYFGYREQYNKILEYIDQNNLQTVDSSDLLDYYHQLSERITKKV